MSRALSLAIEGLGDVWPNPSVGCVIQKNGEIVGEGATGKGGRPHAEIIALENAGQNARGATAYITLEPCSHHGETPPCAEALVKAGIDRVFYAAEDPDPRVSGKGGEILKKAGVFVVSAFFADNAKIMNEGFFKKVKTGRPFITLKFATSSDGKIATNEGISQWITCEKSRIVGHYMRANHDAILVGVDTVIADDPSLTCRIKGKESKSPVRIIFDTNLKTPISSKVIQTALSVPTWLLTEAKGAEEYIQLGVKVITVHNLRDLNHVLTYLADEGLTKILVEGGSKIHGSFCENGFVDKIAWFKAPKAIGEDGLSAIKGSNLQDLTNNLAFVSMFKMNIDEDVLEIFVAKE